MYGPHTNEQLVGRAVRGHREHVTIATKFGIVRDTEGQITAPLAENLITSAKRVRQVCAGLVWT